MEPFSDMMPRRIDRFEIELSIATGGMGEIFLAFDPTCQRKVALKRMRKKLLVNDVLKKRFIREAKIASRLSHPSIIPIFEICLDTQTPYYTMPYVEGQTLKQLFIHARKQQRRSAGYEDPATSIATLTRYFLTICQTIQYVHARSVLHRDLKPENIIIGKYGEVVILDWGLAEYVGSTTQEESIPIKEDEEELSSSMTIPGRIIGTITYLAPERVKGEPTSVATDIYALGVILYQILALKLPFRRPSLKEFTASAHLEKILPPSEVSPHRDIPPALEKIAMRCIEPSPSRRYESLDQLIRDLENYIQGRSDWTHSQTLDINKSQDWLAQADIALSKHLAITRSLSEVTWVHVMLSRYEFPTNTKIEARVKIKEGGEGIGLLFSVPADIKHFCPEKGYCLWLSAKKGASSYLYRSNIQVLETQEICLEHERWCALRVEHVDHKISFYLNGELKFTYVSYLPVVGARMGLMLRDAELEIDTLTVSTGSLSSVLDCLAIPDAFLAHKDFDKALIEYQKIAASFKGQKEGRIALFQVGICRLERAKEEKSSELFEEALEAFSELHGTSGAPLEFLGKALVYEALEDPLEEAKCFELALRKHKHHPLLAPIKEQLHHRLHQFAGFDRVSTYRFLLIIAGLVPELIALEDNQKLISALKKDWLHLSFFEDTSLSSPIDLAIRLAFWLSMPHHIAELISKPKSSLPQVFIENGLFALIEMGRIDVARSVFATLPEKIQALYPFRLLEIALQDSTHDIKGQLHLFFERCQKTMRIKETRLLRYLLTQALQTEAFDSLCEAFEKLETFDLEQKDKSRIVALKAYCAIWNRDTEEARRLFELATEATYLNERSPLFPMFGCYLRLTQNEPAALRHFTKASIGPYVPITALLSLCVQDKSFDVSHLFDYEKKYLELQKKLYARCSMPRECEDTASPA
jgi:eukaryotic-like serine/threonine-protein kinase